MPFPQRHADDRGIRTIDFDLTVNAEMANQAVGADRVRHTLSSAAGLGGVHQECEATVDPCDQLSGSADPRGGSLQGRTALGIPNSK